MMYLKGHSRLLSGAVQRGFTFPAMTPLSNVNKKNVMDHKEIWLPVVGFEGLYSVSNWGNIRSLPRRVKNRFSTRMTQGRQLSRVKEPNGYELVVLCNGPVQKNKRIHRIVAEAFIPNPENKPMTNHKNGIKHDNRVENLEWATCSENHKHAYDTGLRNGGKGENSTYVKLTAEDVYFIKVLLNIGESRKSIAERYPQVVPYVISQIKHGKTWGHIKLEHSLKKTS